MKTIRDFLRKHALLLLAALVVVSVSVGAALGKYAASADVTDKLNLNVSMKTYTLCENLWSNFYTNCNNGLPKTLVLTYKAPEGLDKMTNSNTGKPLDLKSNKVTTSGSIYAYFDTNTNAVYVAPESPGVMYAYKCANLFKSPDSIATIQNALESICLENLDTSQSTDKSMYLMFAYNKSLSNITFGQGFSTSGVTSMKQMFFHCDSMPSLNLSSFDTSNVTDMYRMFSFCNKLKTIYVSSGFVVDNVTSGDAMFAGCYNLVGGLGSKGDGSSSSQTGYQFAHIDGGTTNPGYFTDKNATYSLTYSATGTDEAANGFGLALDLAS